jgi:hypothetical protein
MIIYNKDVQELITERHAFAPLDKNITDTDPIPTEGAPTSAPTDRPTPTASTRPPTLAPTSPMEPTTTPPTPTPPTPTPPTPGDETVEEFLTRTLTDDGALQDPATPQNMALEDILGNYPTLDPDNGATDQLLINQLYALGTLFYSTNGTNWVNRDAWVTDVPPCGVWSGVLCDGNSEVTVVDLRTNDLFGNMPSELRALTLLGKQPLCCCNLGMLCICFAAGSFSHPLHSFVLQKLFWCRKTF